ncbi:alkaline phosphatase family protein [Candidatus Beckwithbacteria bacterium]|nr:alkaline phosphatase family protein [Candidatus Beckwithbacteria bacterium]
MLNQKSIQAVDNANFSSQFKKPLYDSYCFANIPDKIKDFLTGERKAKLPDDVLGNLAKKYQKVVLILLDAFGWNLWQKYENQHPFFKKLSEEGVVSKLTAQFPATTSAEINTLHTNQSIGQHGLYEWFYFEPKVDDIIAPLLFSFANNNNKERENLKSINLDPKTIFGTQNFYQELKKEKINSYVFLNSEYAHSSYNNAVMNGTKIYSFENIQESFKKLKVQILQEKNQAYYYLYLDQIDLIGHNFGFESKESKNIIEATLNELESFYQTIKNQKDILLIITADHGQTEVNLKKTIYLNQQFPKISENILVNKQGKLIVPAGNCRDMFLHIKKDKLKQTQTILAKELKGKAEVYQTEELIKLGFFGNKISKVFRQRVGNLIILPYEHDSVWWYEKDKFEVNKIGAHGGLSKAEMEIPFMLLTPTL